MNYLKQFHWPLIIGMGALALIWPVMSISGLMDALGRPLTAALIPLVVSVIWVAIVVFGSIRRPFWTLVLTGLAYAVITIIMSTVLSTIVFGTGLGPLSSPFGMVGLLIMDGLWGCLLGGIAWGIRRVVMRSESHA